MEFLSTSIHKSNVWCKAVIIHTQPMTPVHLLVTADDMTQRSFTASLRSEQLSYDASLMHVHSSMPPERHCCPECSV